MALSYGRAGRLTAKNGGCWPGQSLIGVPSAVYAELTAAASDQAVCKKATDGYYHCDCDRGMTELPPVRRMVVGVGDH
jgi:hypothetical protein